MDWSQILIIVFIILLGLMALKQSVAFVFLTVTVGMFIVFMPGPSGLRMYAVSLMDSLCTFNYIAVPMFMLMGDLLFRSGMAMRSINALEKMLGKLPGRLSVLAAIAGIIFAATSGSMMANTAMLGTLLVPEMEKKGYHKKMIFGPIMGVSTLAMLIPPSALAVLYASMASISVGKVLIGGILPGLIMGIMYIVYIVNTAKKHPAWAPTDLSHKLIPAKEKFTGFLLDVLPLGGLIFLVIGTIIAGLATPSEAAALGALGAFLLCIYNKTVSVKLLHESALSSMKTVGMVFAIIMGTTGFGQMLAFTGAIGGITKAVAALAVPPILIIILTQLVVLVLGFFIDVVPIMMMTIPIFMPIVIQLGFDPIWFACLNLVSMSMANLTPPFGMVLFVMRGVAPKGTTMQDIYSSVLPFIIVDVAVIALMIVFPNAVTWLPNSVYSY